MLVAGSGTAAAQQAHALKLNVFSPVIRTGSFFYEHKTGAHRSAQLGAAYTNIKYGYTRRRGVTLTPEYRFYLTGDALDGFYLGPFVRFRGFKMSTEVTRFDDAGNPYQLARTGNSYTLGGGVVAGRQWLLGDHITLDVYGGPSFSGSRFRFHQDAERLDFDNTGMFDGFGIRTGFTFGLAF
ncbi:hypothetical protein GCM10027048_45590 [Hymenobacter coalescens]